MRFFSVTADLAEITELASGMVTQMGGSGDNLNRLEAMVSEERYRAAGRVRVAVDSLDTSDIHIREAEQNALAEQALAEFEAKQPPAQISASATQYPTAQYVNNTSIEKRR